MTFDPHFRKIFLCVQRAVLRARGERGREKEIYGAFGECLIYLEEDRSTLLFKLH